MSQYLSVPGEAGCEPWRSRAFSSASASSSDSGVPINDTDYMVRAPSESHSLAGSVSPIARVNPSQPSCCLCGRSRSADIQEVSSSTPSLITKCPASDDIPADHHIRAPEPPPLPCPRISQPKQRLRDRSSSCEVRRSWTFARYTTMISRSTQTDELHSPDQISYGRLMSTTLKRAKERSSATLPNYISTLGKHVRHGKPSRYKQAKSPSKHLMSSHNSRFGCSPLVNNYYLSPGVEPVSSLSFTGTDSGKFSHKRKMPLPPEPVDPDEGDYVTMASVRLRMEELLSVQQSELTDHSDYVDMNSPHEEHIYENIGNLISDGSKLPSSSPPPQDTADPDLSCELGTGEDSNTADCI